MEDTVAGGSLPFHDLRVVSVEQFGAGPWGTMQLADLGADIIKIEDPSVGGDVSRYVPPYQSGRDSLFFESFNRNKRSIALDLRSPAGREVFLDLVHSADAVYSNLRGDVPERLGLRYADLCAVNQRIVCCSLSGFGTTGPRAAHPAYDHVMQGLAGWMSITGEPGGPPAKSGLSVVDYVGGYVSVLALVAAVWRARRDGVGGDCDISLFEAALAQLAYVGTWAASQGFAPTRVSASAHLSLVPFQTFPAQDGWIVVACPKQQLWERLCEVIGRQDLGADERFVDFASRSRHREALVSELREIFGSRPAGYWVELLEQAGIPVAPVNDIQDALHDAQVAAREAIIAYEHPSLGRVRQVASPLRVSDAEPPVRRGPLLGEHTDEVLAELCGYDGERILALREQGAFG